MSAAVLKVLSINAHLELPRVVKFNLRRRKYKHDQQMCAGFSVLLSLKPFHRRTVAPV